MKNRLTNNLGLKVIALLFSILLWLVAVNISDPINAKKFYPEITVLNPEAVTGKGMTYQIANDVKQVTVTVKAVRSVLEKIKTENIKATIDLNEEQSDLVPVRITIEGFEGRYEEALPNPQNIRIKKEDLENKTFPITPVYTGELRGGYVIGELDADPKSIDITGPKSSLGRISKVIARVDVSGVSEDTTLKADELIYYDAADNIIDKSLLSSDADENGVDISVHLLKTKDVELKFDTSGVKTSEGYVVSAVEIEPQYVTVAGKSEEIKEIKYIEIGKSALMQEDVSGKTKVVVDITEYLPEGIELADSTASSVVVNILVEQEGTKGISIPVRSVSVNNAPSNMELSYGPEQNVELLFEGLDEVLESMTAEKIAASIDLKNYKEEGTFEVPIAIATLPEGCSFVGNATIQIILTKK